MSEESTQAAVSMEIETRIHFAMQQNDVPVVKALHIENKSDAPLTDLEVRITTEPAFTPCWVGHAACVAAQATFNFDAIDLQLSPSFLGQLTERVKGRIHAEVARGGNPLADYTAPVEILAWDEWGGLSSLPEILAAFVQPNHPAVSALLRSAAGFLEHWTGDPSLSGYQSKDPRRVYTIAGAVYAALQKVGLTYVNPPASFEDDGQRIRLPDKILDARMATCLDVSLLAAACLEQAGINPLVVLVSGHAFIGFWLHDECFSDPAVDDCLRLRKRVDLSELAVLDPTCVTARPPLTFEYASAEAKRRLALDDTFLCAIDIRRARKGRIRPIPVKAMQQQSEDEADAQRLPTHEPLAPDVSNIEGIPGSEAVETELKAETPQTRLDRWRRKLLDLSLRNRLLNFRNTKKTLQLLCPDLGQLEDMLAEGTSFRILPQPKDLGDRDPRDAAAHQRRTGQEGITEMLREELKAKRLFANTTPEELERRMVEIYRAARLSLEEGGASALYLAIGFLAWYETEKSAHRNLAPLLLLPLELSRNSVREGFTLRLSDDDPRINVTLLELLKQDHGLVISGLDPLPGDESGLDVAQIFHTVRRAVRDIDRWEVLDDVWIGLFSFTKFLMWRDLSERADDLMKNSVVEHLVNRPDEPFDPEGVFPNPDRLDDERSPIETFCPLPADSSQLAAVFAAAEGRSFVLEGPPGTGKSQTITNLIAHCLAEGKTVLFVSEKMAALNVVHRRLVSVGLGRYCLELHSNKAQKREVVDQLAEALGRFDLHSQDEWEHEASRLAGLRNELNSYVRALHQRRSTGETVFQATSRLIGLRRTHRVDLRWPAAQALDADALEALRDLVDRLATAGAACGGVRGNPWEGVCKTDWTPGWEEEVTRAVSELRRAVETLEPIARACSERLGVGEGKWSLAELDLIKEISVSLLASPAPPAALIVRTDWDEIQAQISAWMEHGRNRDQLRAEVRSGFRDDITGLDLDALRTRLEQASVSWWPASWWRRQPIRKALKLVSIEGKSPMTSELGAILDRACALREEQRKLDAASDEARVLLGRFWNNGEAEWGGLAELREWARVLRALATRTAGDDFERCGKLRQEWARLASEGRDLLARDGVVGRELVSYGEAIENFKRACTKVAEVLELDVERTWGTETVKDALGRVASCLVHWEKASPQLRSWCAWRRARAEAVRNNLAAVVEAFEHGTIASEQLRAVFERSYTQWWLGRISDQEPVLSQFFSPEHERRIEQFREVDERYMELTRLLVQARLAQRVPALSATVLPNSEMGILRREIAKKHRHVPVRQLLRRIPNLLPRLKPCLLMSPMSVAQYLDSNYPPFDVVVFDEASQIPVWDAVGAIARGRQAIIVGDPKQLPPTSFFQRSEDGEDAEPEDLVEDLESVLDDCIGAQIPWLPLDWHYRSRHESLITFSNFHYYGNRLLTFPSPALEGLGVKWHHVPSGVYDKGKTRTNRAEADAVVEGILTRLLDPAQSQHSIGVVTFSEAQQTLIEDLLDAARAKDPRLDPFFAEDKHEPIFVKNLENVQGDERDVIFFSICYGPDSMGRVSMNFGPMNREGGERRLNVAITRARREVVVFSTLRADQIDLSRTRARGVHDLKRFIEYAERGFPAIAEALHQDQGRDLESPFEEAVFDALVKQGWNVHKQVGCARYRVDLAVVDPTSPGRYLLGIECDGANYHRAKTARDRDKLREGVLRDLGWKLHRIWSTDWWTDPEQELRKLDAALERARTPEPQAPKLEEIPTPMRVLSTELKPQTFAAATTTASVRSSPPIAIAPKPQLSYYQPMSVQPSGRSQIDFYEYGAIGAIQELLLEVTKREGPISLALAARRVLSAWGFERVRSRALARVRSLIPKDRIRIQGDGDNPFLWSIDVAPEIYEFFRVPSPDGHGARSPEDLPPEEVANAILYVLKDHVSAPVDELVRETARLFGFQRTGHFVEERLQLGIDVLERRGKVLKDGTNLTIRE